MKLLKSLILLTFNFLLLNASILHSQSGSSALADLLSKKDSILFNAALHSCDTIVMGRLLSPEFQFYQNNGGPAFSSSQDRSVYIGNTRRFCLANQQNADSKVKREVVAGTLQTFLLAGYGAIQTGTQQFYLVTKNGEKLVESNRFTRTWRKTGTEWRLSSEFDELQDMHGSQASGPLFDTILHMDSMLFDAFNARDIETIRTVFSNDLEFYHDLTGLTDYKQNIESFSKGFTSETKQRRELDKNSLQVFPIKDYGAMEIGVHRFYYTDKDGKERLAATPTFILIWQRSGGEWKVTRSISYGH